MFVCLFVYCVANSLFIVQKTRSIQSLLLLPALSLRARKQIIKRSKAPIHTYTPDGKCQSLLHLPNSHRSNSVTTGEDYFSVLLSLFFPPQIEASSATKYNANTVFFYHGFFFFWLILICNRKKKIRNTKTKKKQNTKKKFAKTKKSPGECVQRGRAGGGGRKASH